VRVPNALEEHLATRRAAGLFDFSFMGHWEIAGARALEFLERLQTRSLARVEPGRLLYTLLLRDDGGVFVDATVWVLDEGSFWLFTGRRSDSAWITECAAGRCTLTDRSGEDTVLALQGPASAAILARLAGEDLVRALRYFRFAPALVAGRRALVGRLGFSGELGYELIAPAGQGGALRQGVLEAGKGHDIRECGFEAADSLRIESGYVIFDREIDGRSDPFELGLGRLVEFDGRDFIGVGTLRPRRWAEPGRVLRGLEIAACPPRPGARDGPPLARMTSEGYSPLLRRAIGLGFVERESSRPGTLVRLQDGRLARVARLPFYDPGRHLPRR
jgi:glycine cleavage system T protein (aminomethyltransferase)